MQNNLTVECVVFDLDGTITMSHDTIYQATVRTLKEFKLPADFPKEEFKKKIGMHFEDIFNDFGFTVDNFEEFINIYKSLYFDYIDSTYIYPGAKEILNFLRSEKIKTALLTTKTQDQAEKILNHFKLSQTFDFIMGRRPGIEHKPSPEPLLFICKEINTEPAKTMIVGDSELDIQCGKNAGAVT
ncbi:MAG: phosphoglycolate phosphatase, partial [Ignavibacteria bacterium RBG_13_36_8]